MGPRIQQRQDFRPAQRQRHPAAVAEHRGRPVPSISSDSIAGTGRRPGCRDSRTEEEALREVLPSDVTKSASATRTAHRTIRSVSVLRVSSGPETSRTPRSRPVKGSVMGAAVQAHSWCVRTRCSAEKAAPAGR